MLAVFYDIQSFPILLSYPCPSANTPFLLHVFCDFFHKNFIIFFFKKNFHNIDLLYKGFFKHSFSLIRVSSLSIYTFLDLFLLLYPPNFVYLLLFCYSLTLKDQFVMSNYCVYGLSLEWLTHQRLHFFLRRLSPSCPVLRNTTVIWDERVSPTPFSMLVQVWLGIAQISWVMLQSLSLCIKLLCSVQVIRFPCSHTFIHALKLFLPPSSAGIPEP